MLIQWLLIAGIGFFDFLPGADAGDRAGSSYNGDWASQAVDALFGEQATGLPPPPQPAVRHLGNSASFDQSERFDYYVEHHRPPSRTMSRSETFAMGSNTAFELQGPSRRTGGGRCHCGKYSLDGARTEVVGKMQLRVLRHAVLGSGTVGSIYHADWPSGSKCVALKETTRVDTFQFAKQEIAMLGEFKAMGARHIVHMFDYHIGRDRIQIVLELGGPNLEEHWLVLGGPQGLRKDAKTVAKAMKGVALTLIEAHQKGAHLDVKPANLVCFDSAKPCTLKLIDFNSFKAFDSAFIHARHNFADARYISPEMVVPRSGNRERPFEVSKKSDSWSFGIMFYELIYGAEMADAVRAQIVSIAQRMRAGELSMGQTISAVQSVLARVNYGRRAILANGGKIWGLIVRLLKKCIQLNPSDRPTSQQIYDALSKEVDPRSNEEC